MRPRFSTLEQEVVDGWNALAFPNGHYRFGCSRDELSERILEQKSAWDDLLSRGYIQDRWNVGIRVASTLTSSRWYNAMILRDYDQAEREIQRWFEHPGTENADRREATEFTMMLLVARLGQGDESTAADQLRELIESGSLQRGVAALCAGHKLLGLLEDLPEVAAPGSALTSLAVAIATARRASKSRVRSCANASTIGELTGSLTQAMGYR